MRTILAAVAADAAARPVLNAAAGLAGVSDATVRAVHVSNDQAMNPTLLAGEDVPVQLLADPVEQALVDASMDESVVATVMGARRTPSARRPVGSTASRVIQIARKPVVLVPPNSSRAPGPWARLLVPLEGTETTTEVVADFLATCIRQPVELVALHVYTEQTTPRMLDRPVRDIQLIGDEFLARYCADARTIELQAGSAPDAVAEACVTTAVDAVLLSWSQDMSTDHAAVIREVLERSSLPVVLLPVADAPSAQERAV